MFSLYRKSMHRHTMMFSLEISCYDCSLSTLTLKKKRNLSIAFDILKAMQIKITTSKLCANGKM